MEDIYEELNHLTETVEKIGVDADPRKLKDRRKADQAFPLVDCEGQYVTDDRRQSAEDRRSVEVDLQNSSADDVDMEIPEELEKILLSNEE